MQEPSDEFTECWQAAGRHLQKMGGSAIAWLRVNLNPPLLEHLSFNLGNQLFFVFIEADRISPFNISAASKLNRIASGCKGHACLMPMVKFGETWLVGTSGWGLTDATTRRAIHPPALASNADIEMTDWELHDFAVKVIRDYVEKKGLELMAWHSDPDVDPSIWFLGESGPEWIIVRAARYPDEEREPPSNWKAIAGEVKSVGKQGHFASMVVVRSDQFEKSQPPLPLLRGRGMFVRFGGLERLGQ